MKDKILLHYQTMDQQESLNILRIESPDSHQKNCQGLFEGKTNSIMIGLRRWECICKAPECRNPEYGRDHSAL